MIDAGRSSSDRGAQEGRAVCGRAEMRERRWRTDVDVYVDVDKFLPTSFSLFHIQPRLVARSTITATFEQVGVPLIPR